MNCNECDGTGWKITEKGATPCDCRKRKIAQSQAGTPLTAVAISQAIEALSVLSFFPKEKAARMMIGDAIGSMCSTVEQMRHMIRRAAGLYISWDKCGIPGLRQIVCHAGTPADGEVLMLTEAYPEGLRSEKPAPPAMRALPAGAPVTAELGIDAAIVNLARAKDIQNAHKRLPEGKQITAADVEREREKLRMAKAIAERGEAAR